MKNDNINKPNLDSYIRKTMPNHEQHTLEKEALSDPFLSDAIDGFNEFPSQIQQAPTFNQNKKDFIYLLSAIAIVVGMTTFFSIANQNKPIVLPNVTTNTLDAAPDLAINTIKEAILDKNKTVVNPDENPTNNTPEEAIESQPNNTISTVEEEITRDNFQMETLVNHNLPIINNKVDLGLIKKKWKVVAYNGFIGVDYTDTYEAREANDLANGTAANLANKNQQTDYLTNSANTVEYTYRQYLEEIFTDLESKQFNAALEKINRLLKKYPNDVNGQFYKGFIYFNGSQYKKAISQFNNTLDNTCDYFKEDATWYKAQALEQEGDIKTAYQLYRRLASGTGYYSIQAKNKIEE